MRRGAVVVAVLFGSASIGSAATAGAQGDAEPVVSGGANASADSMGFQIVNGGASLGWTFGRATAAYRDITATAEGKAVDLGALGALLGQPQCQGQFPPALDLATLPPLSIADSTAGGSEVPTEAEVTLPRLTGDDAPDAVVGTQRALARTTPYSEAGTVTRNQDFGFFRVEGATSTAYTSFENGIRTAHAETAADRIIVFGGQVVFRNAVWSATATSGARDSESADFTFGSASVFGNFVSGAVLERDLAIFESLVEGILSPLGLDIEFPEVTEPFAGDGIAISPLSLVMSNAALGKDLLIPLLDTSLLEQYRVDTVSEDCRTETFWTIIDALERALGGSGSVETLIGGATATTDDTDYSFQPYGEETADDLAAIAQVDDETESRTYDLDSDYGPADDFGAGDFGSADLGIDGFGSDDLGLDDFGLEGSGDLSSGGDLSVDGLTAGGGSETELGATEEIADGLSSDEIAAADDSDAAGNAAAVSVGVLALLGAVALSLGDRVMGHRSRRRIT